MKIALIGYGRMGQRIYELAQKKENLAVVAIIDPSSNNENVTAREINTATLAGADLAIDFTAPNVLIDNLKKIAAAKMNVVIGTTGWNDQLDEVRNIVDQAGIKAMHAANFSIGVNAFFRIIRAAAKIMNQFEEYDISANEIHHNKKLDSPSGTALTIGQILLEEIDRKNKIETQRLDRAPKKDELHLSSMRLGQTPGTHEAHFDSADTTITLTKVTRNRDGLANGALLAGDWLMGKEPGFMAWKIGPKIFLKNN